MGSRIARWIETLESRQLMSDASPTGVITGVVFTDLNRNAVRDEGEPPLVGYRVFIDRNHDGI